MRSSAESPSPRVARLLAAACSTRRPRGRQARIDSSPSPKDTRNEAQTDLLGVNGIAGSHLPGRWDAVPGRPLADKAREVIYWYFAEVTKMKADIGVSEVEKQAAGAGEDA
jgi:hypothetical protein